MMSIILSHLLAAGLFGAIGWWLASRCPAER
jgi:hypothetical protein